jgi:hypothetical protein
VHGSSGIAVLAKEVDRRKELSKQATVGESLTWKIGRF